ncbi:MAG: universal stress protein [Nitrospirales bacterium]|nr:universal stress protein [Nitrospira sp.]MDR4502526.1 universal stress protein [Nitrospirales bacterium]
MKHHIRRIVFATDFSASSSRTLHIALTWANMCDAAIDIVHVLSVLHEVDLDSTVANLYIQEQKKAAQAKLASLVLEAKKTLSDVQSHLLAGSQADQITQFALSSQADLIVTGTHGWTGFDRVMMGSVAERVIHQAPCPVLSVRDISNMETQHMTAADVTPRHILLPVDFSDCSLDAYEYVDNLEKHVDASITLMHVLEPLSYSLDFTLSHPVEDRQHREHVTQRITQLTEAMTRQGLTANYLIKTKPIPEAIVQSAKDVGADLIVMGTHGRQGLRRLIMGSVTTAVLRHSSIPVMTVKSPKFSHEAQTAHSPG